MVNKVHPILVTHLVLCFFSKKQDFFTSIGKIYKLENVKEHDLKVIYEVRLWILG